ncbi:hypothetical protein CVT25_008788 [Psilocybe cyanescens]|uniref:Uncharacterized protein n=1 Tax=Psilocybe cyanescens TaxID=93625 RepID=A0A409XN00_PSICY|nr:hypothetical protein CVT25_008788 [Psilocybe cyanescens]
MGYYFKSIVKGYAFDSEKIGAVFEFDHLKDPSKVFRTIGYALERIVNSEADVLFTAVQAPDVEDGLTIIVIDDDFEEEKLKNRPMRTLHPELDQYMNILTGPCVWMDRNYYNVCENLRYGEADVYFTEAYKDETKTQLLTIIVLDDGFTEQELMDKPREPVHPDVEVFMRILTGPHVWPRRTS